MGRYLACRRRWENRMHREDSGATVGKAGKEEGEF